MLRIIKLYCTGNNHIIPLETRLIYHYFGVNWYYDDSAYYKLVVKPIRRLTILTTHSILSMFKLSLYDSKYGYRHQYKYNKI